MVSVDLLEDTNLGISFFWGAGRVSDKVYNQDRFNYNRVML